MAIPERFINFVGTVQGFTGHIFSQKKCFEEPTAFKVLKVRWGSGQICNIETLEAIHPTVDLLLKKEGMKKAQWARGFAVTEITLNPED